MTQPSSTRINPEAALFDVPDLPPGLPGRTRDLLLESRLLAQPYMENHVRPYAGLTLLQTALVATARLQWLLSKSRIGIAAMFSEEELLALLECFDGELILPRDLLDLEYRLCAHWGIRAHGPLDMPPLARKIYALSAGCRLVLADTLELAWQGMRTGRSLREVLDGLGMGKWAFPDLTTGCLANLNGYGRAAP